ncbi:MAG: response regulator transcription factor [Elusimicrobia bacterium]|nr:response regulator transcription factor [Elusimicrobiota bacterium]
MLKPKILIVDDEADIRQLLTEILKKEDFIPYTAASGAEALKKVKTAKPDLILLDLQLPDQDGFSVCRELRKDVQTRSISIIMLTVQAVDSYKIAGLELGADDYITKPFNRAELVARVKAVLRRHQQPPSPDNVVQDGSLILDVDEHSLRIEGKRIRLSPKEFDLLHLLMAKPGTVLTRSSLRCRRGRSA